MHAALRRLPPLLRALRNPPPNPTTQCLAQVLHHRRRHSSTTAFQLRDYQEDCVQAVLAHIEKGHRRMGVSLATGSGKTVIFTELISRVPPPAASATQTLILVHRKELVEQAARHCRAQYPGMVVEIEMASARATGMADVTVASIQSVMSRDRIEKFVPGRFKLVLIDECHHAVSKSYLECLDHFGLLEVRKGGPVLVGVSATMSRFDGLGLGKVMDHIVYHRDYVDMIQDNWLSPCHFTTVQTSADLSQVRKGPTGDFHTADLGRAVNTEEANEVTVKAWLEKAGERKSTIVFCVDIAHVTALTAKFRKYGIDARPITSNTILQDRRERLAAFKNGEFKVLVNCGVFTEGTDIPNIDCVLLSRPTRSKNLLVQMIGRGMRLHKGKKDCHVIDMVGSIEKGIVTVPTLFGLDPEEVLQADTVDGMKAKAAAAEAKAAAAAEAKKKMVVVEGALGVEEEEEEEKKKVEGARRELNVTFTDYDNVWDLLADEKEGGHIRQNSEFAWVTVAWQKFVLCLRDGGYLKIEQEADDGTFTVTEVQRLPPEVVTNRFQTRHPRTLIRGARDLPAAVQGADTFARTRSPRYFLLRTAPWRNAPASPEQLKFLERFGEWFEVAEGLTKGAAGDMITKLKHGAIGRWKKGVKEGKRREKVRVKEEEEERRRGREVVKVGRLEA